MLEYNRNLKEPSRELRNKMTEAEQLLWSRLRGKQLLGIQFYRQKPLGPFVVDFYAHAAGVVIEVDGGQHHEPEHARRDAERDQYLTDAGLRVMRFDNLQVLKETNSVLEAIHAAIKERQIPPDPPLQSGEEAKSPPFVKGDSGGFDPIMLSALEHYAYCPRQCALIHVEQAWSENLYTMRGRDVHERVDEISAHDLGGVRFERALPIWCRRLNLTGRADLVEFHDDVPYPVEYKSGSQRRGAPETLQLCAQAICLEEMFSLSVDKGALYWHGSRERREVVFTDAMRAEVARVAAAVHEMVEKRFVPPPVNDKRCEGCSLKESCLPAVVAERQRFHRVAGKLFEKE